jgi:hypothetical protein
LNYHGQLPVHCYCTFEYILLSCTCLLLKLCDGSCIVLFLVIIRILRYTRLTPLLYSSWKQWKVNLHLASHKDNSHIPCLDKVNCKQLTQLNSE